MADAAHKATDKALEKLKEKLGATYAEAAQMAEDKFDDYMAAFAKKDALHKADVASGKWTQKQYEQWRKAQLLSSKQLADVRDIVAQDLQNVDKIAQSMIKEHQMDVYALNHNYATFQVKKDAHVDSSYALYDHDTVRRLMMDDPALLPPPSAKKQKEIEASGIKWNKQKLNSTFTASIMAGDSIPAMAAKISIVADMDCRAAIRNARTMTTGAEAAGRLDAFKRLQDMGVNLMQKWVATLDPRTRTSHANLDGDTVKVGAHFSNGLRFPGDPDGLPREVYNCRCTMVAVVEGVDPFAGVDKSSVLQRTFGDPSMTYEKWQSAHKDKYAYYGGSHLFALLNKTVIPHPPSYWKNLKGVQNLMASTGMTEAELEQHVHDFNHDFHHYKKKPKKIKPPKAADPTVSSLSPEEELQAIMKKYGVTKSDDFYVLSSAGFDEYFTFKQKYGLMTDDVNAMMKEIQKAETKAAGKSAAKAAASDAMTPEEKEFADLANGTAANVTTKSVKPIKKVTQNFFGKSEDADKALRSISGRAWRAATNEEKEIAVRYTGSYYKDMNKALRINKGEKRVFDDCDTMARLINRSELPDMWLHRGMADSDRRMARNLNVPEDFLANATESDMKSLIGKEFTEEGFASCGTIKGTGIDKKYGLEIHVPEGTKGIYAEPFSQFGAGHFGLGWDGKATQNHFGGELETILQRGTKFRILDVKQSSRGWTFVVDIVGQKD